jgi:2-iminobutanoate/2-iminopropanoate deaminase
MRPGRAAGLAVCLVVLFAPELPSQGREVVATPGTVAGIPFSPAVRVGNLLFLSGQIGNRMGTRELVPGGIQAETRQTLENIRAILEAAGSSMSQVVKCTVFLKDIADYAAMNAVYATYWPKDPPARSAVAGSGLALGALVEVECIAALD